MKQVQVIEKFPGLEEGSILTYNETTDLYEYINTTEDFGEDFEKVSFSSITLSPDIVEDNMYDGKEGFFVGLADKLPEGEKFSLPYSIEDMKLRSKEEIYEKMGEVLNYIEQFKDDKDMEEAELIWTNILWTLEWVSGIVEESELSTTNE